MYSNLEPTDKITKFDDSFKLFLDEIKAWDGFEKYVPKFEALFENYIDKLAGVYGLSSSGYNVLAHGDLHIKNLMYKKDKEGDIEDVIFVSF
jgi:hypothetical protein